MQGSENSCTPDNKEMNTSAVLNAGRQKCHQSLLLLIKFICFRRHHLCRPVYPELTTQIRLGSNLTFFSLNILQPEMTSRPHHTWTKDLQGSCRFIENRGKGGVSSCQVAQPDPVLNFTQSGVSFMINESACERHTLFSSTSVSSFVFLFVLYILQIQV